MNIAWEIDQHCEVCGRLKKESVPVGVSWNGDFCDVIECLRSQMEEQRTEIVNLKFLLGQERSLSNHQREALTAMAAALQELREVTRWARVKSPVRLISAKVAADHALKLAAPLLPPSPTPPTKDR